MKVIYQISLTLNYQVKEELRYCAILSNFEDIPSNIIIELHS